MFVRASVFVRNVVALAIMANIPWSDIHFYIPLLFPIILHHQYGILFCYVAHTRMWYQYANDTNSTLRYFSQLLQLFALRILLFWRTLRMAYAQAADYGRVCIKLKSDRVIDMGSILLFDITIRGNEQQQQHPLSHTYSNTWVIWGFVILEIVVSWKLIWLAFILSFLWMKFLGGVDNRPAASGK